MVANITSTPDLERLKDKSEMADFRSQIGIGINIFNSLLLHDKVVI